MILGSFQPPCTVCATQNSLSWFVQPPLAFSNALIPSPHRKSPIHSRHYHCIIDWNPSSRHSFLLLLQLRQLILQIRDISMNALDARMKALFTSQHTFKPKYLSQVRFLPGGPLRMIRHGSYAHTYIDILREQLVRHLVFLQSVVEDASTCESWAKEESE